MNALLRFTGAILIGLCLVGGTVVVGVLIWLFHESIASAVHERMLTFEAAPKEGYDYWKWRFILRQWRAVALGVVILAPLTFGIIFAWCHYVCGLKDLAFGDRR